jgi:hypothetical protein
MHAGVYTCARGRHGAAACTHHVHTGVHTCARAHARGHAGAGARSSSLMRAGATGGGGPRVSYSENTHARTENQGYGVEDVGSRTWDRGRGIVAHMGSDRRLRPPRSWQHTRSLRDRGTKGGYSCNLAVGAGNCTAVTRKTVLFLPPTCARSREFYRKEVASRALCEASSHRF